MGCVWMSEGKRDLKICLIELHADDVITYIYGLSAIFESLLSYKGLQKLF